MKKQLLILVTAFSQLFCFAQNDRNYDLLLSSGTIQPEVNFSLTKNTAPTTNEIFNGVYYRYIQFNTIPSTEQKEQMKGLGINLMLYLPSNTFMAAINQSANLSALSAFNIRSIITIKPEYKLLKELYVALSEKNYPGFAVNGDKIGISFTAYQNIPFETMNQYLIDKGYQITYSNGPTNWFVVWVKKEDIMNFVAMPFVCSAELMDDVPVPDNNVGRTSHRDNCLSTDYSGGRKYNGAGVSVMLQDDGIIGPHIDYTGRLKAQFISYNAGDHGDHCAGIIMGAGNRDPLTKGMAWGSDIYVYEASPSYQGFDSINTHYGKYGIRIISTSYSDGCNAGYTTRAQQLDIQNGTMPQLIHVFSGGNSGTSNCGYGAGAGWGNVTGGHKHSKNSIAVANLDYIDAVNSSSSRGPAHDGRLKPEVSGVGTNVYSTSNPDTYVYKTGTSMSCPGVAGTFAQLYQAYKTLNSNTNPPSALMKAIVMNTADDLGNAGPDFTFGYGRINGLKAVEAIEKGNYFSSSISNSGTNTHTIVVPAGVRKMKVMTYWHDYQAAVSAAVALVNNINTTITDPSSSVTNPLILDFTPSAANLSSVAVQGIDVRNNHEQITLNNPAAGNYVLTVNGASIPMGPQTYYVTWIFEMDGYTLTYPIGGEGFVPGTVETIRWNTLETVGNQTLQYSTNNGATWTNIFTSIAGGLRYFNWTVPSTVSGQCLVKISRGTYSAQSDTSFSIIPLTTSLTVSWACPDSVRLTWNAAAGATSYDVFKLGAMYMDSVKNTTATTCVIACTSTVTNWFSVRARGPLGAVGRRQNAIQKLAGTFSCPTATGIDNLSEQDGVLIYPNPGTGEYHLDIFGLSNSDISYSVIDVSGRRVLHHQAGVKNGEYKTTINISEFSAGIYTLELNRDGNTHHVKLIKY